MRARVGSSLPLTSFLLCLACVALFSAGLVHPSIVRPLNIEDLAGRADRIFSGRCVEVLEARDAALGQTVTYTTFVVTRAVKGALRGRLTIKSLGGATAGGSGPNQLASVPRFRRGEEVVLFLYGDSQAGLTTAVGFGQGKFRIIKDKNGRQIALNATGNTTLFHGLSRGAEAKLTPAHRAWKGRNDIPPDALLDLAAVLEQQGNGGAP